jgi:antitoxin YefM
MPVHTTYTAAREHFADLWRRVEEDRETVLITRRGHADVALVAADELAGLLETAHLLRSPANARRLLAALLQALGGEGETRSVAEMRRELGRGPAEE